MEPQLNTNVNVTVFIREPVIYPAVNKSEIKYQESKTHLCLRILEGTRRYCSPQHKSQKLQGNSSPHIHHN